MGKIIKNQSVNIELEDNEKETLIKSYQILKKIMDNMWEEELDETEGFFKTENAEVELSSFLDFLNIDYVE